MSSRHKKCMERVEDLIDFIGVIHMSSNLFMEVARGEALLLRNFGCSVEKLTESQIKILEEYSNKFIKDGAKFLSDALDRYEHKELQILAEKLITANKDKNYDEIIKAHKKIEDFIRDIALKKYGKCMGYGD